MLQIYFKLLFLDLSTKIDQILKDNLGYHYKVKLEILVQHMIFSTSFAEVVFCLIVFGLSVRTMFVVSFFY